MARLTPKPVTDPFEKGVRPITDREFALFQKLIYRSAGIHLAPAKKALLESRLSKRIRELGLKSFGAYYECVIQDGTGREMGKLLDRIATNETHFFREPRQFEFLETRAFPAWKQQATVGARPKLIRAWSAGCSTGEEPFSVAMVLADHFPRAEGWQIEIFATDLSNRALEQARAAIWSIAKAKEIPLRYLKRFMLRGTGSQDGNMKATPEIASQIRFENLNLNDPIYPVSGFFDLILCRNVLIYFDASSRERVLNRLLDKLAPGGFLLVGHAESLGGLIHRVRYVMPTIYALTATASPPFSVAERHLQGSVDR
jgi:chemotaxis protein methyltransferase CheR